MLEFVRNAVKSWVAKVFLGLLVASFAIFGIGDVFSASLGSSVATVGEQKVTAERYLAAFNREMRTASQRFGQPVDVPLARQIGLDRQVLGQLASEATLDQTMSDLELSAPDEAVADAILGDPTFQAGEGFDEASYRYAIANAGFTVETYEEEIRRTLARNQLTAALVAGGASPAGAAEQLYLYQNEERRFDFIALTTADHADEPAAPDEAALTTFHEENEGAFSSPETRDVVYLHVDIDALAATFEADEEQLRALYENRASIYDIPERRALYQIVFDDEATAAAAKTRIDAGETDFDGILETRGETRADVSLGELAEGELASAVAEASFATPEAGVVGPVDTGFGFALVDIAAITPAETVPFEDARAELALDINREAALDAAPGVAGEIEDLRAGGSTLEEIAAELGLELGEAKALARSQGDGFAADPRFQAEAFAAEQDEERDMIETEEGDFFVLRVDQVTEAALRPLDDVRAEVEAGWRAQARRDALDAKVQAATDRVEEGELLAVVADEMGVDMQSEGFFTRSAQWQEVPADLVQRLFLADRGVAGYSRSPVSAETFIIAQVAEIKTAELGEEARGDISDLEQELGRMAGADALELFLAAKQEEVGVSINAQLIESLLSQSHGGY